ncbi:hypothetical protein Vadar_008011 [Vaccinium darrowii]|uniref:Uncharacterized protein n=1 Tax=Vaccinium darrowii TaxID=229202 RepID=A0ACB7XPF2_9ERIC|nr:hypothetical protein Vadar_008011 [Vaccinium darrowii]
MSFGEEGNGFVLLRRQFRDDWRKCPDESNQFERVDSNHRGRAQSWHPCTTNREIGIERWLNMSEQDYDQWIQASLDSPMPGIGMYVAAASLVCSVAMAGDVIHDILPEKALVPMQVFHHERRFPHYIGCGNEAPGGSYYPLIVFPFKC